MNDGLMDGWMCGWMWRMGVYVDEQMAEHIVTRVFEGIDVGVDDGCGRRMNVMNVMDE